MPPVGFEPTITAVERPQTYTLDRAATGTGYQLYYSKKIKETQILQPMMRQGVCGKEAVDTRGVIEYMTQ